MKPLKIGLIIDTSLDTVEGVPQYVLAIGSWLVTQGHDVHYLAGETHRQDIANMHSLARNIGVRFNGTTTTIPLPARRRKLRKFIQSENFDILHVQTPHHPLMAQWLILAAGKETAVIATFHVLPYGWVSRWGTRMLRVALQPSLQRIDTMLAVSVAAARYEEWAFGLPAVISPNTIDYPRFNQAQPFKRYSPDKLTILFLGRWVPRKGCLLLLQALTLLDKRALPSFRVLICGKGPLERQLRAYVQQHKLDQIVEFVGFVSEADKPRYYASADISVFPSSSGESFGIVLLEAMASGRAAVLAGDNPGYRSVMETRPELLFDPKNAAELAVKLQDFIEHQVKRRDAAEWGKNYTAQFDQQVVGSQLVTYYDKALRKRRKT